MRLVCLCVLAMDAVLGAEVDVVLAHVLAALVIARRLDAQAQAVLRIGLVRLERSKRVALALQVSDGPETRSVADKDHPVQVALRCGDRELALEVGVDEGDTGELPGREARDGMAVELASKARFADGVWLTLRADREARDEALADRRSEVVKVRVRAALVPKREVLHAGGRRGERILWLSDGVA